MDPLKIEAELSSVNPRKQVSRKISKISNNVESYNTVSIKEPRSDVVSHCCLMKIVIPFTTVLLYSLRGTLSP
jgi:hypothetical protein